MQRETRNRIRKAAEDWNQGYDVEELTLKHDRSEWTIYQWKNTDVWMQAVAARKRQTRSRYDKESDPSLKTFAGHLYVAHGKPASKTFAKKFGVPVDAFEDWRGASDWKRIVRDAEVQAKHRKYRTPPTKQAGPKFPYHLLERAIYLYFAGSTMEAIGKTVGKSAWTIRDWQKTDAWQNTQDGVLFDKLKTHLLEKLTPPNHWDPDHTEKDLERRHTRVGIYVAAERWIAGYTIKEIAEKHNHTQRTIHEWKNTEIWKQIVAGRERRKGSASWQEYQFSGMPLDLRLLDTAAYFWVKCGKPTREAFSPQYGVSEEKLERWMTSRFWDLSVRCAETDLQARENRREKARKRVGSRLPYHLLIQAVVLSLTGWTPTEIGAAIHRNPSTIVDWRESNAWQEMKKDIYADELLKYIVDLGRQLNQI